MLGDPEGSQQVDVHLSLHLTPGLPVELPAHAHPGVVDQSVQTCEQRVTVAHHQTGLIIAQKPRDMKTYENIDNFFSYESKIPEGNLLSNDCSQEIVSVVSRDDVRACVSSTACPNPFFISLLL